MPLTDDELVEKTANAIWRICGDEINLAQDDLSRGEFLSLARAVLAYARPIIEREARDKVLDQAVQAVANAWQNTAYFHAEAMIAACDAILALKDTTHD